MKVKQNQKINFFEIKIFIIMCIFFINKCIICLYKIVVDIKTIYLVH